MVHLLYWIWLTLIEGVGPKRQRSLLENFNLPIDIYKASLEEILKCDGIGTKTAENIIGKRSLEKAKYILEDTEKFGIKILTIKDDLYPEKAKNITEMATLLYYKGDLINNSMGVGIVGARRCTDYGKMVTNEAASFLARENISVISGMAKGIDGYAHTSAIKEGGYNIAILGNGLDICYPPEHIELMRRIIENGALISEYPPGTPPNPRHFPKRNLIISAWSHKLLVIEAAQKSGSLITANYANTYNREVLALPDNIYNNESAGTNKLILDGATIYLDKKQLLIEDKFRYKDKPLINKCIEFETDSLDDLEKQIIEVLKTADSKTTEELSIILKIDQMELLSKLSLMDLEGKIVVQGSRVRPII